MVMDEEILQAAIDAINDNQSIYYRVYFKKNKGGMKEYYVVGQISAHAKIKIENEVNMECLSHALSKIQTQLKITTEAICQD